MKSQTLILPEVSSLLMVWIFNNTVNALWRSCWKYISLDFICLPFLDFLCHLKIKRLALRENLSSCIKKVLFLKVILTYWCESGWKNWDLKQLFAYQGHQVFITRNKWYNNVWQKRKKSIQNFDPFIWASNVSGQVYF